MRATMNRLIRYKAFQKLTISYFLLVLLTVSLLSGVLFYLFSKSAVKEIDRNSTALLSQISYASDVIYNQVITIGNSLLIQPEIIAFLNDTVEDKTSNYHIYQQLSQIKSSYSHIHSIGIYRPSTDTTVDTAGLPFDSSLSEFSAESYMEFYPRSLSIANHNNNEPLRLLTFLLHPDVSLKSPDNPLIYINIEENSILTTIHNISKADPVNNVFVINNEGVVISHTEANLFLADLSGAQYVQRILSQDKAQHSFTENIHHEKHLVTYVKSEEMGWYFISASPYSSLISNIDRLRTVMLLVTIAIVLAGLLISIFLTKNIYKPLSTLFEKIMRDTESPSADSLYIDEYKMMSEFFHVAEERERSMQFVINRSSSTIREHYLHSILRGHTIEHSLPDEIIHDIDERMLGPYFCVVVFKINESEQSNGMDVGHQPLLRFALGNIAKEMLENIGECDYLIMGKNESVAIIQYAKNQAPEELKPALHDIQNFMSRYFKVMVSIGIGDISYGKKNLHYSYTSAQQYVRYRLIYGKKSILDTKVTRPHIMTALSYPSAYEKKLLDAVQSGKPEAIQDAIGQFIEQISSGSINQIITYSIQLMLTLLKRFEYLQHVPDSDFNNYLDATADIESAEHLNEIKDIFYRYCFNICELMEEKSNWINAQKHNVEIEKVLNYIQEHYDEPGLSLESVSNIANLSPSYLGKLFKGTTKQSFSEFLNHTRLEKAKDLLASTNDTAAKISESVGIYNITYFSTLFKKKYGLTPSAFREQEAIKRSGSAGKETLNQRQAYGARSVQ